LNSLINGFSLPSSGRYRIEARSWSARSTGSYQVSLTSTQAAGPQTVIIEDGGTGFSLGGPSQYWLRYGIGSGGATYATWNNGPCSSGPSVCPQGQHVNYAAWRPNLPAAGTYRVCAYIPPDHAYTRSARYQVAHSGGVTTLVINQQPLVGWVSLGTFSFAVGTGGYVRLGDWTGEPFTTTQIGFDAVKWVANGLGC
jgi:hypothetical protein